MHGPSTEDSSSSDIVGPFTRCGKVVIEALLARRPSAEEMGSPLAAGDEQDMIQWISHYDEGQDSASASTGVWPSVSGFSDSFIGEFRTELEQLELVLQRSGVAQHRWSHESRAPLCHVLAEFFGIQDGRSS